jgi:Prokaryotic dksA/traR C4-type zinc finger
LTGFELERVEILLRERSAEMTRTRPTPQPDLALDDAPLDQAVPDEPSPVLEVVVEGICRDCGDRISSARLKAIPHAVRCVDCRRELEARAD